MINVISHLIFIVLAALGISYQIMVQLNLILFVGSLGLLVVSTISLIQTIQRDIKKREQKTPNSTS